MKQTRNILTLAALAVLLSACSAANFAAQKEATESSTSVFGNSSGDATGSVNQGSNNDSGGAINQGSNNDSSGSVNQNGGGTTGGTDTPTGGGTTGTVGGTDGTAITSYFNTPGQTTYKIWLFCSTKNSAIAKDRTTFKLAFANDFPLQLVINNKLCTSDKNVIKNLILQDTMSVSQLRSICPSVVPTSGQIVPQLYTNYKDLPYSAISSNKAASDAYTKNNGYMPVLWARYADNPAAVEAADANCDEKESPLVVHVSKHDRPKAIELSSKAEGVFFDLLGAANAHKPVRISWFTNDEYYMLALPNKNQMVQGIDELFGNFTTGPDGKFAANGYAALAKYDANHDGKIDKKDPVFNQLRLWQDTNRDGIGQAGELESLVKFDVDYIDLDYSTKFAETDQWGNQTLMKSVVRYNSGAMDLIFDLWFAYRLNY